ncbi:U-scoloptoxin(16)-Er13a-like [Homalodisca vitripennis]|uniref:U-scoloptoxin(16)-Er13a-like n=1 Tax=Homalodisca vitripennis TaxID=197043 RepID=UPI001EEBF670|nr:U-scoloptoxin(16)-Er13a-like [Homalodisca vitripennis]
MCNVKITYFSFLFAIYYVSPALSFPPCMEGGQKHPPGSEWTSVVNGECKGWSCSATGELSMSECPLYSLLEGCYLTPGDLTKNYPDCCPEPFCPAPP